LTQVIAQHSMPNISFASGGDSDMSDFVAYVAKDSAHGRACYVLDCLGGRAQEVISTIGQAFELRFKEFLKRSPRPECRSRIPDVERDYYNDLPGKLISSDQS
jgi:SHC-transforming protein 1